MKVVYMYSGNGYYGQITLPYLTSLEIKHGDYWIKPLCIDTDGEEVNEGEIAVYCDVEKERC